MSQFDAVRADSDGEVLTGFHGETISAEGLHGGHENTVRLEGVGALVSPEIGDYVDKLEPGDTARFDVETFNAGDVDAIASFAKQHNRAVYVHAVANKR